MAVGLLLGPAGLRADPAPPPPLSIARAGGAIAVDGRLEETAWQSASRVETWYETNPGDNAAPKVRNVGYLAYDDRFLYAAFEFDDPVPRRIRAPFTDRDGIGSDIDYGGLIVDTRDSGRVGILFLATPRGIQYDAVSDDTTGSEDSAPDFFWDSAAQIGERGWALEMRIPFSSLRYERSDPQTWRVMLYRNYPREYRYQFFSTTLPRGGSCFICRSSPLAGLAGLPAGGHLVLAPYASVARSEAPEEGVLGSPLTAQPIDKNIGLDLKWTPSATTALDGTINPDFSQIESDVAQIGANERFALFYSEKRPFFLEGTDLFSMPINAVYSRTITSPRWGVRNTGRFGSTAYTALFAQDRGGGSVIIPGVEGSELADQDFRSLVGITRVRREIGRSYVGLLGTTREVDGGGHNRVFGPDFQWRRGEVDSVSAQLLWADTETPNRPDLADEWDGRTLRGHGFWSQWLHTTRRIDLYTQYKDFSREFRADDGFVPEVGVRQVAGEYGFTFRPTGLLTRLRPFLNFNYTEDREGAPTLRRISPGVGMDGRFASHARLRFGFDQVRSGGRLLTLRQLVYDVSTNPAQLVSGIGLYGWVGQEVDFDNHRVGRGANVNLSCTVRPTSHLELRMNAARRWLNVDAAPDVSARLFTARVQRLRATYTLSSRIFARAIVQWVETTRDPSLYIEPTEPRQADLSASLLLAYRLNWQTVLFVGYGDERQVDSADQLQPADRQVFLKVSYALQP